MIGNNIKRLRIENGMTQKALADKLFVSAQAVSRWENNDVEPSLGTITELSKIFGVSTDEILGVNSAHESESPESNVIVEKEYAYKESPKQVLAICTKCNDPIYDKKDIHRELGNEIICSACKKAAEENLLNHKLAKAKRRRTLSFIIGPLAGIIAFIILTCATPLHILISIYFGISIFTLVSCCLLANTFVGEMALTIFSWGFVQMPGIIFSFDIDGCVGFIIAKILLTILGLTLALACALLAVILGGLISLFVYPYAITKNKRSPEKTEI